MACLLDRLSRTNRADPLRGKPLSDLLLLRRRYFVFVAGISFVIELSSITPLLFMWNVLDRVISSRRTITLLSPLVMGMLAYGFWSVLARIRSRVEIFISQAIDCDIANSTLESGQASSAANKDSFEGEVHNQLNMLNALQQQLFATP